MQALIDFLVRNLMALWPVARVYEWQHGILVRLGAIRRELEPGRLHWRWPFIDEVRVWPRPEITVDLPVGSITSLDSVAVAISANLSYRMESLAANYRAVYNSDASLVNLALGMIASECARKSWTELSAGRSELESHLATHLNATVQGWGLSVTKVHLTDLVRARQFRLIGDQPRPGLVSK